MNDQTPKRPKRRGGPRPGLPGDLGGRALRERMIRVDHAGEFGARRIYEGQLAVLGRSRSAPLLKQMYEQEKEHLATFERLIGDERVRPTVLQPLWHVAGFMLGAGTALLGEKAAMACTIAVEEVIDEHYAKQAEALSQEKDQPLKATIETFRADELEHRDIAIERGGREAAGYPLLSAAIKTGSRLAIWLSERF
jgi:ubiquinone biosynthesis monooxygenase Coq7